MAHSFLFSFGHLQSEAQIEMERWQAEMSMGSLREAEDDDVDLSPLAR